MRSKRAAAGGRPGAPLQVLLVCSLLACGVLLAGIVNRHSTLSATAVPSTRSSSSSHGDDDLRSMLKGVQEQLAALQTGLPGAIKQELQSFHGANGTARHSAAAKMSGLLRHQQRQLPPSLSSSAPQDAKAHHVGQARAACGARNATGIELKLSNKLVAPVVIVAHKRVHYLAKCLMTLLRHWSADPANEERFPIFVSVDDGEPATLAFAAAFNFGANVQVIHNMRDTSRCKPTDAYCNLSVHYHMLMQLFFDCLHAPRLIILEEDLEVAPDFFNYFSAFAPLLDRDKSLMCVSAWNDHGQRGRASDASAVYRTDIFPGLGWMLTADVGRELAANWPDAYWDEYLRRPDTRKGRQCLFPEVSRTHTFGKDAGASKGQLFKTHLGSMVLNQEPVDWAAQDVSAWEHEAYARQMADWLAAAERLPSRIDLKSYCDPGQPDHADNTGDALVLFSEGKEFTALAKALPPMLTDLKGQSKPLPPGYTVVPRASYKGVVIVRCRGRRLFIAPLPGSPAQPTVVWQPPAQLSAVM